MFNYIFVSGIFILHLITRLFDTGVIKLTRIYFFWLFLAWYSELNYLSTFPCLPNHTICQTLQNTLLFSTQHFRSTQNAYQTAIYLGLRTDNSRWGPGLENRLDAEAIRNPIHAFLPVKYSMFEMVHCQHEKGFFCFFMCGRFFLISTTNRFNSTA